MSIGQPRPLNIALNNTWCATLNPCVCIHHKTLASGDSSSGVLEGLRGISGGGMVGVGLGLAAFLLLPSVFTLLDRRSSRCSATAAPPPNSSPDPSVGRRDGGGGGVWLQAHDSRRRSGLLIPLSPVAFSSLSLCSSLTCFLLLIATGPSGTTR